MERWRERSGKTTKIFKKVCQIDTTSKKEHQDSSDFLKSKEKGNGEKQDVKGMGSKISRLGKVDVKKWMPNVALDLAQNWSLPAHNGQKLVSDSVAKCTVSLQVMRVFAVSCRRVRAWSGNWRRGYSFGNPRQLGREPSR